MVPARCLGDHLVPLPGLPYAILLALSAPARVLSWAPLPTTSCCASMPRCGCFSWSLPQPLSAWIRRHSLFSRSYFSGCFKTPNMPGTTSLMRQAEEVAMAVAEKNPSARPTRSLSTSLFPLRVFQGRRNRLSPLHFLRSSQAGLTLDMLHESSRNLEKPFLPMTASFPSENLAIDPDKI